MRRLAVAGAGATLAGAAFASAALAAALARRATAGAARAAAAAPRSPTAARAPLSRAAGGVAGPEALERLVRAREAVDALATACAARNALLVHYSTDYVFPGDDPRPRREDDPIGPINVYGASKLAGEEAIRASGCRHLLFRISWVYAARGHNFLRTMLRLAGERDELRVVSDQIGAPTPAHWIAEATAKAIAAATGPESNRGNASSRSGTWHLAAGGETSWHGFAEAIFEEAQRAGLITQRPPVVPVPTSEYPAPARRPTYSRLDSAKLERDFGIVLPDWRQGLSEVIAALRNHSL